MPQPHSRTEMYRTYLAEYSEAWKEFFIMRREDGILEVRMHTDDGPAQWSLEMHRAFIPAFADISHDPENECLIITGTGDSFLANFDAEAWERQGFKQKFTFEHGYDMWYADQTREPFALLTLQIPIIAAINGPLIIHAELALLNDLVICSETTTMSDGHYSGMGIVPGDGVHTLFRELMGHNRGKYFLLTGQSLDAGELLQLGLVSEILPQEQVLARAWELARTVFMTRARSHRRITREVLVQPWRELFTKELGYGQGLESWATMGYWPLADEAHYDIASLKKTEGLTEHGAA